MVSASWRGPVGHILPSPCWYHYHYPVHAQSKDLWQLYYLWLTTQEQKNLESRWYCHNGLPSGVCRTVHIVITILTRYMPRVRTYGSFNTYGLLPRSNKNWRGGGTVTMAYRLVSASWRGPVGQILPSPCWYYYYYPVHAQSQDLWQLYYLWLITKEQKQLESRWCLHHGGGL